MQIRHNSQMVTAFATQMLEKYYEKGKKRKGLHRSDAYSCPEKPYWRVTGEIQPQYRSRDVGTLLLGTLSHEVMEESFAVKELEIEVSKDLFITVDAMHGTSPIEIKSTRKRIFRREDLPREWIEQLSIAMAVMNVETGYLIVLNIISFGLTVWEFTMSEQERKVFFNAFIWQILSISDAIQKRKPELLTPKYEECKNCTYRPSRGKEGCRFYRELKE